MEQRAMRQKRIVEKEEKIQKDPKKYKQNIILHMRVGGAVPLN